MQPLVKLDNLEITHEMTSEQTLRLVFKGQLGESFRHNQIPKFSAKALMINLEGITFISSVGIREWVLLINSWTQSLPVYYERCSICFVDQVNMVPDCLGSAKMMSFYAPYFCNTCEEEMSCLIELPKHKESVAQNKAPQFDCKCDRATGALEFDALEESYFSFLSS